MTSRGMGGGRRGRPAPDLGLFGPTGGEPAPRLDRAPAQRKKPSTPGSDTSTPLSVTALTRTARDVLQGAFTPLWVRGEVSDFKAYRSGHWYFCLRDATAQIRCVVWASDQLAIPAPPDDGMQVVALGQLTVYPARGDMQLVVTRMDAEGDGLRRKALERTIARLTADGLLAVERKRPLPLLPRRVAVVTSPDGAALRDIIAVVRRRCPGAELVVASARVQGDGAVEEIVRAVERVGRWGSADVVIIGRGGGGREDLWAFNDERVARAVAACPVPTISAVGHEIDLSICDLVADLRAATPSAAAEAAVPVLADLERALDIRRRRLEIALQRRATLARNRLRHAARDLQSVTERLVERRHRRLESLAGRLHALSPLATLARGYAIATSPDGRTLSSIGDFAPDAAFRLTVRDGTVTATTLEER